MFQKKKLAIAASAMLGLGSLALSPTAEAVYVDNNGNGGQVLIFPYYNVNNNFQTAFNIRNTKNEYKAFKVRFRESQVSNDVLDFNVYMSPNDMWTMTVVNVGGNATLTTEDNTCTFPAITGPVGFKNVYDVTQADDLREGYLEIIEIGEITEAEIQAAVLHNNEGVPSDCSQVTKAWGAGTDGNFKFDSTTAGLGAPTGGLVGTSILVDTGTGSAYVADPVVIGGYSTVAQHYAPDSATEFLLPSLASGDVHTYSLVDETASAGNDLAVAIGTSTDTVLDWGANDPNAAPFTGVVSGKNPYPIAQVLAASSIDNEFFLDAAFDGATDWVITQPMRKHGIYNGYRYANGTAADETTGNIANYTKNDGDVLADASFWDREEAVPAASDVQFSPPVPGETPDKVLLEREVSILSFTSANPVLGSDNATELTTGFDKGWARIALVPDLDTDSGDEVNKLNKKVPVIGFAAIRGTIAAGKTVGETIPHNIVR